MAYDGSAAGRGEEGGGRRRFRRGDRGGEGSRGTGDRIDLPGDQREDPLEGHGNPLSGQGATHMKIRRRDFLKLSGAALSGGILRTARAADTPAIYDLERFGNARILHITDTHAQLQPVYFREPSVNIGVGDMAGQPPHLVAKASSIATASGPTAPTPTR